MTGEPTLGDILAAALSALPDDRPLVVRAAFGDLDALRAMADAAYQAVTAPRTSAPLAYMEAITFTRLAAAQGDDDDARTLVYLLSSFAGFWREKGHPELEIEFEAQALHLAETLAEGGDEEVSNMVVASAPNLSPAVHLKARQLRAETAATTPLGEA